MTLLAHQHRMVQEREELADRLGKLGAFITGPRFASLDHEDRRLLIEQNDAMTDYLRALTLRIERFIGMSPPP